ncbi:MAG: hypothetical protein ACPGF7_08285 [Pontibacterium sp.]
MADVESMAWDAKDAAWNFDYQTYFRDLYGIDPDAAVYVQQLELQQGGILAIVEIAIDMPLTAAVLFDYTGQPVAEQVIGSLPGVEVINAPDAQTGHFYWTYPDNANSAVFEATLSADAFNEVALFGAAPVIATAVSALDSVNDFGAPAEETLDYQVVAMMNTADGGYLVAVEAEMLSNGGTYPVVLGLKLDAAGNLLSKTPVEGLVQKGFQGADGNLYLEVDQYIDDGNGGQVKTQSFQQLDLNIAAPVVSIITQKAFYDNRSDMYGFDSKLLIDDELVDFSDFPPNGIALTATQSVEAEGVYQQTDGSVIARLFVFDENDPVNNSFEHLVRFSADGTVLEEQSLAAGFWAIDVDEPGNSLYLQSPVSEEGIFQIMELNLEGDSLPTAVDMVNVFGFDLDMNGLYPNMPEGYKGVVDSSTGNDYSILLAVEAWNPVTDEEADITSLVVIDETVGIVQLAVPVTGSVDKLILTEENWIYFSQSSNEGDSYYRLNVNDASDGPESVNENIFWAAIDSSGQIFEHYINNQSFDFTGFSTENFPVTAADEQRGGWYSSTNDATFVEIRYWSNDLDADRSLLLLYGSDATSPDDFLYEATLPAGANLLSGMQNSFLYAEPVEGQPGEVVVQQAVYDTTNGFDLSASTLFGGNSLTLTDLYPDPEVTNLEVQVGQITEVGDVTLVVSGARDQDAGQDLPNSYIAIINNQTGVVLDTQVFENTQPWNLWPQVLNDDVYFRVNAGWDEQFQTDIINYYKADLTSTADTINLMQISEFAYNDAFGVSDPAWDVYVNGYIFNYEDFPVDGAQLGLTHTIEGIRTTELYGNNDFEGTLVRLDLFSADTLTDQTLLLMYGADASTSDEVSYTQFVPAGHFVINTWNNQFTYLEPADGGQAGEVLVKQGTYDIQTGFTMDDAVLFGGNAVNMLSLFPSLQEGYVSEIEQISAFEDISLLTVGAWNPSTGDDIAYSHLAILESATGTLLDTLQINADAQDVFFSNNGTDLFVGSYYWDYDTGQQVETYYQIAADSVGDYSLVSLSSDQYYAALNGTILDTASYSMDATEQPDGSVQVQVFLNSEVDINAADLQFLYDETNFNLTDMQLQPGWTGSYTDRHDGDNPVNSADIAISAISVAAADTMQAFAMLNFVPVNADTQFDISLLNAEISSSQMVLDKKPPLVAQPDYSDALVLDLNGGQTLPDLLDLRNAQLTGNELTVEVWFNPQNTDAIGSFEWDLSVQDSSGALISQVAASATPNFDLYAYNLGATTNLETSSFSFSGAGSVNTEMLLTTVTYQLNGADLSGVQVALSDALIGVVNADQTLDVLSVADDVADIATGLSLDGVVSFWADQTLIAGTDVVLQQGNETDGYTTLGTAVTDNNGEFSLDQIASGEYQLSLSLTDPAASEYQSVVSAAEASTAARLAVGLIDNANISEYAKMAADVDQNGQVSAADASMIARQAVGLAQLDGWIVLPELSTARLDALSQDTGHGANDALLPDNTLQLNADTSQNYVAVLLGDIDGSATNLLDDLNALV